MKSKILSLAMALCMVALVFTALPTKGEVHYTGTVQTMDSAGILKDVFFQGDVVYVNVTLYYDNVLVDADIRVQIWEDGNPYNQIDDATNDPAVGYYNSTISTPLNTLETNMIPFDGDMTICDIVLSAWTADGWVEVDMEQITLRKEGLTLSPTTTPYYPGQEITATVMTSNTDEFFVEVLDSSGHDLVEAQTHQTVDETGVWTWTFTIPDDAEEGTYDVLVTEEVTLTLWFWESFVIATFYVDIYSDRECVLPGETVTVEYIVYDIASLSLYTEVTSEWNAIWFNESGEQQLETGELVPSYLGDEDFTIPVDINMTSDYDLHFWVNDTEDRSAYEHIGFELGQLGGKVGQYVVEDEEWVSLGDYLAGEKVNIDVGAWVAYEWDGDAVADWLPEADVDIVVEKDGAALDGYSASGLETGVSGLVEHDFTLEDDAATGTYLVTATIAKVGYSIVRMATFDVGLASSFVVELDKAEYYSGETATASFTAMWGTEAVSNLTVFFVVYSAIGNLTYGNTTSGEASFEIPEDFVGELAVKAITMVNGNYLQDWTYADVYKAFIALAPVADIYAAGDTVTWNFQILTAMTEGLLSYEIVSSDGDQVVSTTMDFSAAGSVSYIVPSESAADSYTLTMTLKDGLGNEAKASSTVYLESDYMITVWLENDSGFVSRAFEPGDEVEIGFEITTNGVAHMSVYRLWVQTDMSDEDMYVLTTATTGTVTVTVPEETTDGLYWIDVYLWDAMDTTWGGYLWDDWVEFGVLTDQSGWDKEVAGMSAIDFTLLVLIIVMIVLLIVVPFLKGRSGPIFKKKEEPAPMTMPQEQPPSPPAQ